MALWVPIYQRFSNGLIQLGRLRAFHQAHDRITANVFRGFHGHITFA